MSTVSNSRISKLYPQKSHQTPLKCKTFSSYPTNTMGLPYAKKQGLGLGAPVVAAHINYHIVSTVFDRKSCQTKGNETFYLMWWISADDFLTPASSIAIEAPLTHTYCCHTTIDVYVLPSPRRDGNNPRAWHLRPGSAINSTQRARILQTCEEASLYTP